MKKKSRFNLKTLLINEYEIRKKKNPSYSKRAFANHLGIDQSSLSKFFRGERAFSPETIEKCLKQLKLNDSVKTLIEEDFLARGGEFHVPEESILKILGHWKYWAILEYLKIDNSNSPKEIGRRLKLSIEDVQSSLTELEALNFVKIFNEKIKILKPNNNWIATEKTSKARKSLQMSLLHLSLAALKSIPIEQREHGSLTVAIDAGKLPQIKNKIRKFQQELGNFCQKDGNLEEVYQLTISFFPISSEE